MGAGRKVQLGIFACGETGLECHGGKSEERRKQERRRRKESGRIELSHEMTEERDREEERMNML